MRRPHLALTEHCEGYSPRIVLGPRPPIRHRSSHNNDTNYSFKIIIIHRHSRAHLRHTCQLLISKVPGRQSGEMQAVIAITARRKDTEPTAMLLLSPSFNNNTCP